MKELICAKRLATCLKSHSQLAKASVHDLFRGIIYVCLCCVTCCSRNSVLKNLPADAGDVGLITEAGRSPVEGNGSPLQYSCLENPMDRRAWLATVHEVAKKLDMIQGLNTSNNDDRCYVTQTSTGTFLSLWEVRNLQHNTFLISSYGLVSHSSLYFEYNKGRGTRDQIANIRWIIEKAREFQKNIYFCFIDYAKAFNLWITTNCGKFLKRWEYQTT